MPSDLPGKICCVAGCDEVALPGRSHCEDHHHERRAIANQQKAAAKVGRAAREGAAFYKTDRWKRGRLRHLAAHPLCVDCIGVGLITAASDVDHIRPHRGDARLMWDQRNWQSLCHRCHSRKTAREVWHGAGDSPGWSIPYHLKPSAIPVTLVCGPPGAGKSTLIRQRARGGDVIVDFDIFLSEVGGRKWDTDPEKVKAAFRRRDQVLRSLADRRSGAAWVIAVAPSSAERAAWVDALGPLASVTVLDVPAEVCKARISLDPARVHAVEAMGQAVDAWWGRFDPHPTGGGSEIRVSA